MAQQAHGDVVRVHWKWNAQSGTGPRGDVHLTLVERRTVGGQPHGHTRMVVGVVGDLDEGGLGAPVRVHAHVQVADSLVVRSAADRDDFDRDSQRSDRFWRRPGDVAEQHDLTIAIGRCGDLARGQRERLADG